MSRLALVSEALIWSVLVVSPEGSDCVASVLEVRLSGGSNLLPESPVVSCTGSVVFSAVEAESVEGSEVIFLRQDA